MKVFEQMQTYYQQRDLAARKWKEKGGKVVGYLCDSVPEELILAAGFFPLRISGDPLGETEAADKYTEPVYEGFVRSILDMILTAKYDFLDYLIIPHSRDSIHGLYDILGAVQGLDPALKLPELYLFDLLHTKFWSTELYNRERLYDFKRKLEEWSGREITDQSLADAIALTNENKMLLKQVAALRVTPKPRISGVEALTIIGSSMFMLKEDHNDLLRQFLKEANELSPRNGVRLYFEGGPLDNLQFYKIVESVDCTIVAEDNCWGNRYSDCPIDTSLPPVEAIASRYHLKSPCPRMYPLEARVDYCLQGALEAKAQGVIFNIFEWDYAQTWEYPEVNKALEQKKVPTLTFKKQSYRISEDGRRQIVDRLKPFVVSEIRNKDQR
ncbi:2-hydroxyacyl-CoA dehydratase subunit D [Thermodesulfobacteriota bacterium]